MTYTVCIRLPNTYYTIHPVTKEDAEAISIAFEKKLDSFIYLGKKYEIRDIIEFKVFSYDHPDDYYTKINANAEALKEGYHVGKYIFFEPHTLARLFTDVTTEFIRRFSLVEKSSDELNPIKSLQLIFEKFHLIVRQLRNRYSGRPTLDINDEYDVQNLLHVLLTIYFDDIRPEEWTPSYAGKSSRMDFLLKDFGIIVEVKKTRSGLTGKEIGTQLIEDVARYQQHQDCEILLCFVYDPEGFVGNPRGMENDLGQDNKELKVKVYVRP